MKASTYRLLAEGIVARGVTTVRLDKRGMFASATATPDANAVTIADYVADVHGWISSIRQQTGASCVWLLGHSEGGLVAMAAAQNQQDVCGLILVAAAGRPFGKVLRDQLKANPANAPLLAQAFSAIDALEAGTHFDTTGMNPARTPLLGSEVQEFLISEFSYDPAALLKNYFGPVLVVQGERDIQVRKTEAETLKSGAPTAILIIVPDANHVLKTVTSDDLGANIATYADPGLKLAPGIVDGISKFLTGQAN